MKVVYIAGPYIGSSYMDIERNIHAAEEAAITLWNAGFGVFCPHLNTAHFEVKAHANEEQYKQFDMRMLSACDILYLLPTWGRSKGARDERAEAVAKGQPVYTDMELLITTEAN